MHCWFSRFRLTHWGRVRHICVSKLTISGSDIGLSPGRRQAIIWTNAGILLIRTSRTNFSDISSTVHTFSFKKMHLRMSSVKFRPCCLGLNVLTKEVTADHYEHICYNILVLINNKTIIYDIWVQAVYYRMQMSNTVIICKHSPRLIPVLIIMIEYTCIMIKH